jgi:hypothetical protein
MEIDMNQIIRLILVIFVVSIGSTSIYILLKQFPHPPVRLSFGQRLKRSLISGCMLSVAVLSFFITMQLFLWNGPNLEIKFPPILTLFACLVFPTQVLGTVGMLIQLGYSDFYTKMSKNNDASSE